MILIDLDQPHYVGWDREPRLISCNMRIFANVKGTVVAGKMLYQDGDFAFADRRDNGRSGRVPAGNLPLADRIIRLIVDFFLKRIWHKCHRSAYNNPMFLIFLPTAFLVTLKGAASIHYYRGHLYAVQERKRT